MLQSSEVDILQLFPAVVYRMMLSTTKNETKQSLEALKKDKQI